MLIARNENENWRSVDYAFVVRLFFPYEWTYCRGQQHLHPQLHKWQTGQRCDRTLTKQLFEDRLSGLNYVKRIWLREGEG